MTVADISTVPVEAAVRDLIAEVLGFEADEYVLTDSFAEGLDADSLSMIELTVAVEETFGVLLADSPVLAELTTPALLISYLINCDAVGSLQNGAHL